MRTIVLGIGNPILGDDGDDCFFEAPETNYGLHGGSGFDW